MIRRHGNKALPVMEEVDVPRKRVKGAAELVGVVYKVEVSEKKEGQPEMLWSQVKQAVKDQCSLELLYITFDKALLSGFLVLDENLDTAALKSTLSIQNLDFSIAKAQAVDLKSFWDKHGNHYNGILKKLKQVRDANDKVITFLGTEYKDVDRLKQVFRNIVNSVSNGQVIKGESSNKLDALLAYHEKHEQKLKNKAHYVVDVHPEFPETRCFFVVKEDGTKEDFSFVKCINRLANGIRVKKTE